MMDRNTYLTNDALIKLGFNFDGQIWFHREEDKFYIDFTSDGFTTYYKGDKKEIESHLRIVGMLEKFYFEKTQKFLF